MIRRKFRIAIMFCLAISLFAGSALAGAAGSGTSAATRIWLYVDKQQSFVNGAPVELIAPATVIKGKMYVPVKFLGDTFGFPVQFDAETNSITMQAGETDVYIDMTTKTTLVNGWPQPFEPTFSIINDKLMAQLTWMMDQIGATYEYDGSLNRVEVLYAPFQAELPSSVDSKPIAKFTFGKPSYKMGEKVKYIDLSYDAEGDGIKFVYWKNAQEAFFEPGKHEVSLQVEDSEGNKSEWVTRTITIENETLMSPVEFQMNHARLQSFVKLDRSQVNQSFARAEKIPLNVQQEPDRTLVVSNSPENIKEFGVLYRDQVNGKARLYASHINEMDNDVQFAIIATNKSAQPVTITTTRQGEVYPSTFINLIGYQASVDFLVGDANKPNLTLNPGESKAYAFVPKLLKGQGINLIYDIETTGNLTFTFAAMIPNDPVEAVESYPELAYDRHVRGTFPVANIRKETDATFATTPKRFTIGDTADDAYVAGYDVFRKENVVNYGNYGVLYNLRVKNPGKAAVVLLARGGIFKGALKINGEMVLAPASGVITPLDGVFMLYRTTGAEPYLDIEITPPAGSYFPVDIVLYPLD